MPNLSIIPSRAVRDPDLTDTQVRVLCAIGTFTNRLGGNVWASVKTLASQSNLSERSVQRAIPALMERGYIRRSERPGRTNLYDIILDTPNAPVRGDAGDGGGVTTESPERPKVTPQVNTKRGVKSVMPLSQAEDEAVKLIWDAFPARDVPHNYVMARNAIVTLMRGNVSSATLRDATMAYRKRVERERTEPKYVKSLHGFFADDYWRAFSVARVYGRTREEWIRSGQDVSEFDRLLTLHTAGTL